jgi:hypothetical protein
MTTNTEAIAAATGQSKSEGSLATPEQKNGPPPPKRALSQKKAQARATASHPTSKTPSRPLNGNGTAKAPIPTTRTPSKPLAGAKRAALDPAALIGISANDLCPCGSGQKYKFCHGVGKK